MALPTALFAMIASFALASAAVLSSVDVQQGSSRDRESKNAIAAADAGASVALLRLNRFKNSLKLTHPCIGPAGEEQAETSPGSGWCPPTSPETVGGSTFSYQVSAYRGEHVEPAKEEPGEEGEVTVVAVGTAGGVSRRVEVGLAAYDGENVFKDSKLVGQKSIYINGNAYVHASLGTNGGITRKGSTGEVCADVRVGVGQPYPEQLCKKETGYTVMEGEKGLPAIVAPENIETENDDCRLVPNCLKEDGTPDTTAVDLYNKARSSKEPWEAATGKPGTIRVGKNASLTLGGEDYLVCKLLVENGQLIIGEAEHPLLTGHVRIFVASPERCGYTAETTQVEVSGNANIVSTGYNPAEGKFEVPQIYVLGSTTIPTKVKLCGTSGTNELILYAPYSTIEMCGNATWIGMLGGQKLELNGNPVIESDPRMPLPKLAAQSLWERTRYVECTGATASSPAANC